MSNRSLHAQRALERLKESWAVNMFIHSDAIRNDAHCPSPGDPNRRYNQSREYYLGSLQVCHAGDTLNSYCQSIMGEIIKLNDTAWENFNATIKEPKPSRAVMIAKLLAHRGGDGTIRAYLRDSDLCYWPFESEVIALLRNRFVHQNGHDSDRAVEKLINSKKMSWCVICTDAKPGADVVRYVDSEWLDADVTLGQWACAHVRTHIDTMDQNLCYRFGLSRDRWRPRPISRQLGSLPAPRKAMNSPTGTLAADIAHEPTSGPNPASNAKPAVPVRRLIARRTPEESQCELDWHNIKDAISAFIDQYVQEAGVSVVSRHGGGIGFWAHTVKGLEMALEYDMAPADRNPFSAVDRICIRLRERELSPFVTIWSRRCAMKDFATPTITPEIEEYLKDVIDKVVTQNS